MKVFFYGLFMDEELLASKGIAPSHSSAAYVRDFALHIGERAALLQRSGSRAYGLVMDINQSEAAVLYSDNSVADYFAEPVTAELMDGSLVEASCYNLPVENIAGKMGVGSRIGRRYLWTPRRTLDDRGRKLRRLEVSIRCREVELRPLIRR